MELQFGHGVEAVDDVWRFDVPTFGVMLQFGHGVEAVDELRPGASGRLAEVASIRPRR